MHLSAGLLSTLLLASFLMTSPALGAPSGSPPDGPSKSGSPGYFMKMSIDDDPATLERQREFRARHRPPTPVNDEEKREITDSHMASDPLWHPPTIFPKDSSRSPTIHKSSDPFLLNLPKLKPSPTTHKASDRSPLNFPRLEPSPSTSKAQVDHHYITHHSFSQENHGSSSRRRSDAPFHYISPQGGHRTPNRRNSDVSLRSTSPDAYDLGLSSIAPSEVMSVRGQRHNRNGPSMDVNVFDDSRNIIHTLLTEGISGLPSKETSINEVRRWQIKLNHQIELLEKCRKDIEKDSNKLSLSLKDAEDLLLLMRTLPHSFHSLIQGNPIIVADDNQKPAEISDTARLQEPPKEMVFLRQKLEFMELMRRELKEITSQCEKLKKESLRHQQLGGMENLQLKVKYLREQLKKEKPIHHKFMKKLLSADVMGQLMANERATVRLYVYVEIRRLLETTASHHFSHIEDMMYIKSALKFIAEEKNSKEFDYFKKANEEVKRLPAISHSFQLNKGKEATGRDLLLGPKSTNSPKPQEDKDGVKKALEIIATELSLGLDDLARCIHKDIVEVIKNAKAIRENVAQAIKPPKEKSRFRWRG